MVNGADDVYVERQGRIERVPEGLFEGEEAVLHLIERIVGPLGIRVEESSPWADARLPDGSRVQIQVWLTKTEVVEIWPSFVDPDRGEPG